MHITLQLGANVNTYFYSAKYNSFFPLALKDDFLKGIGWPDDAVEITDQIYNEFTGEPPVGKIREPGESGLPVWGVVPPPTKNEILAQAGFEKQSRIENANDYMNSKQWPGKAAIGRLKEVERLQYSEWLDYLDALEAVSTSSAPDIKWPIPPASAEG